MPSREAILKNLEKGRKAYSEKCEREKIEKAKKLLEQYEQKKQEIVHFEASKPEEASKSEEDAKAEKPAETEEPEEEEDESSEDEVIIERVPKNREALSKIEAQIAKMIDKIELMEARAEAKMRKHSSSKKKKKDTPPSSESEDSDDYEARGGHSVKRKQNRGSAPIVNVYPQSQPMAIPKANTERAYLKF